MPEQTNELAANFAANALTPLARERPNHAIRINPFAAHLVHTHNWHLDVNLIGLPDKPTRLIFRSPAIEFDARLKLTNGPYMLLTVEVDHRNGHCLRILPNAWPNHSVFFHTTIAASRLSRRCANAQAPEASQLFVQSHGQITDYTTDCPFLRVHPLVRRATVRFVATYRTNPNTTDHRLTQLVSSVLPRRTWHRSALRSPIQLYASTAPFHARGLYPYSVDFELPDGLGGTLPPWRLELQRLAHDRVEMTVRQPLDCEFTVAAGPLAAVQLRLYRADNPLRKQRLNQKLSSWTESVAMHRLNEALCDDDDDSDDDIDGPTLFHCKLFTSGPILVTTHPPHLRHRDQRAMQKYLADAKKMIDLPVKRTMRVHFLETTGAEFVDEAFQVHPFMLTAQSHWFEGYRPDRAYVPPPPAAAAAQQQHSSSSGVRVEANDASNPQLRSAEVAHIGSSADARHALDAAVRVARRNAMDVSEIDSSTKHVYVPDNSGPWVWQMVRRAFYIGQIDEAAATPQAVESVLRIGLDTQSHSVTTAAAVWLAEHCPQPSLNLDGLTQLLELVSERWANDRLHDPQLAARYSDCFENTRVIEADHLMLENVQVRSGMVTAPPPRTAVEQLEVCVRRAQSVYRKLLGDTTTGDWHIQLDIGEVSVHEAVLSVRAPKLREYMQQRCIIREFRRPTFELDVLLLSDRGVRRLLGHIYFLDPLQDGDEFMQLYCVAKAFGLLDLANEASECMEQEIPPAHRSNCAAWLAEAATKEEKRLKAFRGIRLPQMPVPTQPVAYIRVPVANGVPWANWIPLANVVQSAHVADRSRDLAAFYAALDIVRNREAAAAARGSANATNGQ